MSIDGKETTPPEVRVTVTLLLDTEKKIDELRRQLNSLGKAESPSLNYNPRKASDYNRQNTPIANEKARLQGDIASLTNKTLQIVEEIEKASPAGIGHRVASLKNDWIKDLEPLKPNETKSIVEAQKSANRVRNKDWHDLDQPAEIQTPFELNKDDIDGRKASYLDKARRLKEDYAYLEKDANEPVPVKDEDTLGLEPIKPAGPDIDIEKD